MHRSTNLRGWILFLLCAVVFGAVGIRDGDALLTLGSALFFAAWVLFLVPSVVGGDRFISSTLTHSNGQPFALNATSSFFHSV
jgi:hypothetical protein